MGKYVNQFLVCLLYCLIINIYLLNNIGNASEKYPERIVSLGPIITDMIHLLKAEDRLIAVSSYCVLPKGSHPKEIIGTVMQMNVEKIISMEPDLVLANALTRQKQILVLKKQGINVIRLSTPKNFTEICQRLVELGKIVGGHEQAMGIVQKAKGDVEKIIAKVKNLKKRTVFIQIGLKPLKTAAKDTFINEYIEFAGGENIALNAKDGVYSREKVLQQNPDVIFIATMGSSKKAGDTEKQAWMKFKFLKASKNNEIHILNPDIVCSPTPFIFAQGLKDFYQYIHPELK
jgi:iron complex transport system substrate-binding protein